MTITHDGRNAAIKEYICKFFVKKDEDLLHVKKSASNHNLPNIAIPENVGMMLYLLTKIHKPKRILEIGTLAGYSTLWFAKGAPTAEIITLESNPFHVSIAEENFKNCNKSKIKILEGDALKTLQKLIKNKEEPFDLIFLDADKKGYPDYFPLILKLSKKGTLLLTDNLIPKESRINEPSKDDLEGTNTYHYNELLASHPEIETILAPTIVGNHGRVDALGISLIQ